MWKILYQLSSPKFFYQRSQSWIPKLVVLSVAALVLGMFWGLFWAPSDYQQGDAFRIIYLHVPSAFLSMGLYAWMIFLAFLLLIWRIKMAGIVLMACAQIGALMAFLTLITGSIWGKPMWGTWWVWDARLTSELILWFIYMAILAMGYAYPNKDQGDKVAAILTLVGMVDLPIIHYSVYWWNTLHQGATVSLLSKPKMDSSMLPPLLFTLLGLSLYCGLFILLKTRHELLSRERRQSWVREALEEGRI
jgi:heme exporter protein C